jgi:hypothetical protein
MIRWKMIRCAFNAPSLVGACIIRRDKEGADLATGTALPFPLGRRWSGLYAKSAQRDNSPLPGWLHRRLSPGPIHGTETAGITPR